MACDSHANHPARLRALKTGAKRFKGPKCKANRKHVWRFVSSGKCAQCSSERNRLRDGAPPSDDRRKPKPPPRPTIREIASARRDTKLPMIGGDLNDDMNKRRLINATEKFLRLLHEEALRYLRECPNDRTREIEFCA